MAENELIQPPENMELNLDDGTQVAGVGKVLRDAIKKESDAQTKKIVEKPDASVKPIMENRKKEPSLESKEIKKGSVVIPEAKQDTVDTLEKNIEDAAVDLENTTSTKPPKQTFNFDVIAENKLNSEDIPSIINGFAETFNIKTERITFKSLKEKAAQSGIDEKFIQTVIGPNNKIIAGDAEQMYKAMTLLEASAQEVDTLMKLVSEGNATDIDRLKLRQQITLHGLIQKSVKKVQADTARALAIMRVPRDTSNVDVIRRTLDERGGDKSLNDLVRAYMNLKDRDVSQKEINKVLEKSIGSSIVDVWLSTYINALLSSFPTHAKNIIGNGLFGLYQMPERIIAGMFGEVRKKGFKVATDGDYVELDETLSDIQSFIGALKVANQLGKQTWKSNTPTDVRSKTEIRNNPSVADDLLNIANNMGLNATESSFLNKGIQLYGRFVEIPGRALLTQDEWFKAFHYRLSFNRLITRQVKKNYRANVKNGMSPADAEKVMEEDVIDLYQNPPDSMVTQATEESLRNTFTNPIPKELEGLEPFFQHPIVKLVVPFFRTPANIAFEVIERTPFGPLVSSRQRANLAAGGAKRDLELAKISMTTGIMLALGNDAMNGAFTGRGASRKEDRDALLRSGWQPYSIRIKVGDKGLAPETLRNIKMLKQKGFIKDEKFLGANMESIKGDYVYISYAGFEPISAILAMAADFADYARYHENQDDINKVFLGATFGLMNYMKEQPFLTGVKDLVDAYGDKYDDSGEAFLNALSEQVTKATIVGSPGGVMNSFVAAIERTVDPTFSDKSIKGQELPVGVAGFYEAFNAYRSRVPYLSKDLPPKKNYWGQDIKLEGDLVERSLQFFLPTRVSRSQADFVDEFLVAIGSPLAMPQRKFMGVEMTASQYNEYLTYLNIANADGLTFKEELGLLFTSQAFGDVINGQNGRFVAISIVKGMQEARKKRANAIFLAKNPDFLQKNMKEKMNKIEKGQFYKDR